jgi:hypothetical protein
MNIDHTAAAERLLAEAGRACGECGHAYCPHSVPLAVAATAHAQLAVALLMRLNNLHTPDPEAALAGEVLGRPVAMLAPVLAFPARKDHKKTAAADGPATADRTATTEKESTP